MEQEVLVTPQRVELKLRVGKYKTNKLAEGNLPLHAANNSLCVFVSVFMQDNHRVLTSQFGRSRATLWICTSLLTFLHLWNHLLPQ